MFFIQERRRRQKDQERMLAEKQEELERFVKIMFVCTVNCHCPS